MKKLIISCLCVLSLSTFAADLDQKVILKNSSGITQKNIFITALWKTTGINIVKHVIVYNAAGKQVNELNSAPIYLSELKHNEIAMFTYEAIPDNGKILSRAQIIINDNPLQLANSDRDDKDADLWHYTSHNTIFNITGISSHPYEHLVYADCLDLTAKNPDVLKHGCNVPEEAMFIE